MISIDSADPAVHDQVRGKQGAFTRALHAVDLILGSPVEMVGFSCTIDRHNYSTIPDIVELAVKSGVQAISFMQNRYNLRDIFDRGVQRQYERTCREIYELMLAYRGRLDIYTHDPFMLTILDGRLTDEAARADFIGANLCNVGTSMVSIDPVGNVTGCNFISQAMGNVRDRPFQAIWDKLVNHYSDELDPPTGACSTAPARLCYVTGCAWCLVQVYP
jgi:radical SAM protein with 4Fe4S-binding SPASM domain